MQPNPSPDSSATPDSHAPLPWHVNTLDGFVVYDELGNAVCDAKTYHGRHQFGAAKVHAQMIVSAVNGRDALLAEKAELLAACQALLLAESFEQQAQARQLAGAAIAKAKGGSK